MSATAAGVLSVTPLGTGQSAGQAIGRGVRLLLAVLFGTQAETVVPRRRRFQLLRGGAGGAEEGPRPTVTDLYHAHRLGLVRLAILLVDDLQNAEDVVQESFTSLYQRHGEDLDDLDNALAYLRTTVVNNARSVLRRRRTVRAYVPPHEPDAASAEDHAIHNDEHRRVLAALQELTPRQREVLVLRYWSDLSEARIAETLDLSRGAVKSTASRALDALEKKLEQVR
ncbi:SigE family RNA polymerase sigma factor [Kitasatospora cathayae]|uniref:SigE family RNA polymerase sigma factor n=1 Tax=Kitasatospora cathayae TaxID=3004092 RepID=A0ABY7Q4V1_9ACTN|nr:SigE family RNA polymerase sigma factor [Kitasatospora sp. HUAS 3-15]WBP87751.1 SigE family RNA polymerase sigma factor [Kitasatospora sp. HUAS 3-15]